MNGKAWSITDTIIDEGSNNEGNLQGKEFKHVSYDLSVLNFTDQNARGGSQSSDEEIVVGVEVQYQDSSESRDKSSDNNTAFLSFFGWKEKDEVEDDDKQIIKCKTKTKSVGGKTFVDMEEGGNGDDDEELSTFADTSIKGKNNNKKMRYLCGFLLLAIIAGGTFAGIGRERGFGVDTTLDSEKIGMGDNADSPKIEFVSQEEDGAEKAKKEEINATVPDKSLDTTLGSDESDEENTIGSSASNTAVVFTTTPARDIGSGTNTGNGGTTDVAHSNGIELEDNTNDYDDPLIVINSPSEANTDVSAAYVDPVGDANDDVASTVPTNADNILVSEPADEEGHKEPLSEPAKEEAHKMEDTFLESDPANEKAFQPKDTVLASEQAKEETREMATGFSGTSEVVAESDFLGSLELIVGENLSVFDTLVALSGDRVREPGSPQNRAATWVLSSDPRGARDPSDPLLIQRYALATLYHSTGGPQWTQCHLGDTACKLGGKPWLSESHECVWVGVFCNFDGTVASIDLGLEGGNGLAGDVAPEIGLLTSMQELNLQDNAITSIPATLARAPLVSLVLSNNLIASFPASLHGKKTLARIEIDRNDFQDVPLPDFAGMPKLEHLFLQYNSFTGTIDPKLGNLKRLRNLDFAFNQLEGGIPEELGGLIRLVRLDLEGNQLTGTLPPLVASLPRVTTLALSNNRLTGSIPRDIGSLGSYWVESAKFRPKAVRLDGNTLSGAIPAELANIDGLSVLALHGLENGFTGNLPLPICMLSVDVLTSHCSLLDCKCSASCTCVDDAGSYLLSSALENDFLETTLAKNEGRNEETDTNSADTNGASFVENDSGMSFTEGELASDESKGTIDGITENVIAMSLTESENHNEGYTDASDTIVAEENVSTSSSLPESVFDVLYSISGESLELEGRSQWLASQWIQHADALGNRHFQDKRFAQRYVLAILYFSTGGDSWDECFNGHWKCTHGAPFLSEEDECYWAGISCNEDGMVTAIELNAFGLSGELTEEIGYLKYLEVLELSNNFIGGIIPPSLSKTKLSDLLLANNSFRGILPTSLNGKDTLEKIHIDRNYLHGDLPNFASMPNLKYISAYDNAFVGGLDPQLATLQDLRTLQLSGNQLNFGIPTAFGTFQTLEELDLSSNLLGGVIPFEVLALPRLMKLDLSNNSFNGSLDDAIGRLGWRWSNNNTGERRRKYILLEHNLLTGPLPASIGSIPHLHTLSLHGNKFSGSFPQEICNLRVGKKEESFRLFQVTATCALLDCSCSEACLCID